MTMLTLSRRSALLTALALLPAGPAWAGGPIFTQSGGISAAGSTPGYSITGTGYGSFSDLASSGIVSGAAADLLGNTVSGGTPTNVPSSNTLTLSCLPNGFPGGAANVRNHAQVCIEGIANQYGNNGIYVNGVAQTGATAYNDNDYMLQLGLDVRSGSNNGVGLYNVVQGEAGASQFWAMNTVTQIQPGFTNNAFGYELDMNNVSGSSSNTNIGMWLTGTSSQPNYAAVQVTGASGTQWHLGYLVAGSVDTAAFINQSSSSDMLVDLGAHAGYGLKMAGTYGLAGIRLTSSNPSGAILWTGGAGGYPTTATLAPMTDGALHLTGAPLAADGGITSVGNIAAANFVLPSGASIVFQNASGTNTGTMGYSTASDNVALSKSLTTPGTITAAGATINGTITASGPIVANGNVNVTTHYLTFTANASCYLYHDDSAAGLVYVCAGTRLMRIPDNGGAPVFKTAPVAGTP